MLNSTNCHLYTLDRIQSSSYYRNLPRYLNPQKLDKSTLCTEIQSRYSERKFSGNPDIRKLISQLRNKNFYPPEKLKLTKIFYLSHLLPSKLEDYITRVPQIAINGDEYIVLQNSNIIQGLAEEIEQNGLLNYLERRQSRKKIIASPTDVFAIGGYPETNPYTKLSKPYEVIIITAAGTQFENTHLEYQDFIVDKTSQLRTPLFKHYYPHSQGKLVDLRTAWNNATNYPPIMTNHHIDLRALRISYIEDIYLILTAFHHFIPEGKKGYFHATAIGSGFFANLLRKKHMGKLIMTTLLDAYQEVLTSKFTEFPRLETIVFPDWSSDGSYTPKWKSIGGIVIKTEKIDVLDFQKVDQHKYICGTINPGDCFSLPGNEFKYSSVESMIGNNTDLRIRQNYNWNPFLLTRKNQFKVTYQKN